MAEMKGSDKEQPAFKPHSEKKLTGGDRSKGSAEGPGTIEGAYCVDLNGSKENEGAGVNHNRGQSPDQLL